MKKIPLLFILVYLTISCSGKFSKQDSKLFTLDLSKEYEKIVLSINDIVDIAYVPLCSDSTIMLSDNINICTTNKFIVTTDNQTGDIFCFDKNGKVISHINKRGQGPEEYFMIGGVQFNEESQQVYIWSIFDYSIKVYDLAGNFKKKISLSDSGDKFFNILSMLWVDDKGLFYSIRDMQGEEYYYISDTKEQINPTILYNVDPKDNINIYIHDINDNNIKSIAPDLNLFSSFDDKIYISIPSNDTIFEYVNNMLLPVIGIINRELNDCKIISEILYQTDEYYFVKSTYLQYDFRKNIGLDKKYHRINKKTGDIKEIKFINQDYKTQSIENLSKPLYISSNELFEASEKGLLDGKLELEKLKISEESNGVVMCFKRKYYGTN